MIFGYTRVSTKQQSTASQLEDLKKHGYDELFEDTISGKTFNRPEFDKMMNKLRSEDIVLVWRLDRLGRSIANIMRIIEIFNKKNIHLVSIKDGIDTRNKTGKLILGFMATLSEYEYELLAERRLAGIDEARRRGIKMGRKAGLSENAIKKVRLCKALYENKNYTVEDILQQIGISRATFYKYLKFDFNEISDKKLNEKNKLDSKIIVK